MIQLKKLVHSNEVHGTTPNLGVSKTSGCLTTSHCEPESGRAIISTPRCCPRANPRKSRSSKVSQLPASPDVAFAACCGRFVASGVESLCWMEKFLLKSIDLWPWWGMESMTLQHLPRQGSTEAEVLCTSSINKGWCYLFESTHAIGPDLILSNPGWFKPTSAMK